MNTPPPDPRGSESGAPPLGAWSVRPPTRARGRGFGATILVVFGVGMLLAGGAAVVSLADRDDGDAPSGWDPVVEPIATFVSDERGLEWHRAVPVRFLDEEEFVREVTSEDGELTDEDRASLEESQAVLEALSLLPSDVDLFEAVNAAAAASVLAFYSYDSEEIVLRGRDMTPALRVTLAHELTHALQDQHFDLGALQEESDERGSTGASTSVVEGDASLVEEAYLLSLSGAEQDEYLATQDTQLGDALRQMERQGVPEIVSVVLGFPYALGPGFVQTVVAAEGGSARDELFEPDVTEADVLTPRRYLEGTGVVEVTVPRLPEGAMDVGDPEPFGAIGWYLTLAAHLDPVPSLRAADGWAGDVSVTYRLDGRDCVMAAFRGDTAAATDHMAEALDEWSSVRSAGRVEVARDTDDAVLRACSSMESDAGPTASLEDALVVAAVRTMLFAELLAQGGPEGIAWCVANALAFDPEIAPLFAAVELTASQEALVGERAIDAAMACAA